MRHRSRPAWTVAVRSVVVAFLMLPVGCSSTAYAVDLTGAITQHNVTRAGPVVPLDPSGSKIAFSGSTPEANWLGDSVWIANGDGSDMRKVGLTGRDRDVGIYGVTASGDGQWIAYTRSGGFVTDLGAPLIGDRGLGVINVATGLMHTVKGAIQSGIVVPAPRGFFTAKELGPIYYAGADASKYRQVQLVGPTSGDRGTQKDIVASQNRMQLAQCDTFGTHGKYSPNARLRIALLDRQRGVLRASSKTSVTLARSTSCQVSDDGSTAGSLGRQNGRLVVMAIRGGKTVVRRVRSGAEELVALSPSGKFALLQRDSMTRSANYHVQLVNLDNGRTRAISVGKRGFIDGSHRSGNALLAGTAWSSDETQLVVTATRVQSSMFAGRLLLINTTSGRTRLLPLLPLPAKGKFQDGKFTRPTPVTITDDGKAVIAEMASGRDDTDEYPYRVPLDGSTPQLLLTSSVRSYGSPITRSADHSRAWLSAGWSCSSSYKHPLMMFGAGDPWSSPWELPKSATPQDDEE